MQMTVSTRPRVERRIDRPAGLQTGDAASWSAEGAPEQDPPVGLHPHGVDRGVEANGAIEVQVGHAVAQQLADATERGPADIIEGSAQDDLAARTGPHTGNECIRTRPWVEGQVMRSIGINSGDKVSRHVVEMMKPATDDDPSVRLHRQRKHQTSRSTPRIE